MKLLFVEWADHVGYRNGWMDFKECDNKPVIIHSVGWLIHEDKNCISLSSCVDQHNPNTGKNVSTILKNCITKRKVLKI